MDNNFDETTENEIQVTEAEAEAGDASMEATSVPVPTISDSKLFEERSLLELSCSSWTSTSDEAQHQPFCRGCLISPDGTCCLLVVHCDGMHLLELDQSLVAGEEPSADRKVHLLDSVVHVKESGLVYDFCWYPSMNSSVPETCCWLTTRRHAPIQLWDAYDGGLRCTYRGYDAVDEVDAALSVTFSSDGSKIFGGYKKNIKIFDTQRPGRDYAEQKIHTPAASMAVSKLNDQILLVGSWRTDISLYDVRDSSLKSVMKFKEHSGGVTHLKFLPDSDSFVSGARKDDELLLWDLKYSKTPVRHFKRRVDNNQRIYFDISPCGNYLVSGGTDGILRVWNLKESSEKDDNSDCQMFQLYEDCCNGVSIHPYRSILATCSGQLHSQRNANTFDEDMDDCMESKPDFIKSPATKIINNFQFWWTGKLNER